MFLTFASARRIHIHIHPLFSFLPFFLDVLISYLTHLFIVSFVLVHCVFSSMWPGYVCSIAIVFMSWKPFLLSFIYFSSLHHH
ncbi:hypothetical protein BJX96DRAFT_89899 [Aspergillus floccosus]